MSNPTISEIVKAYLVEHGYDGLYINYECQGCLIDNLIPCDDPLDCKAGYRNDTSEPGLDWIIGPEKMYSNCVFGQSHEITQPECPKFEKSEDTDRCIHEKFVTGVPVICEPARRALLGKVRKNR